MDAVWQTIAAHITRPGGLIGWLMWLSAVICFLIAYFVARHVRQSPHLFTAVALLGATLVLVLTAIDSRIAHPQITSVADRAYDIASLLLVFSGAVLAREAPPGHWLQTAQRWTQTAGLWLLFVLVLPGRLQSPLALEQTQLAIGEVLSNVGYLSIGLGAWAIADKRTFRTMVAILVCYSLLSLARTLEISVVPTGATRPFPEIWFAAGFIMLRFLLTGTFCYMVITHFERKHPK